MNITNNLSDAAKNTCEKLLVIVELSSNPAVKMLLENKLLNRTLILHMKGEVKQS
jgi:hypothetical protein